VISLKARFENRASTIDYLEPFPFAPTLECNTMLPEWF
jgi:hypothetical protein